MAVSLNLLAGFNSTVLLSLPTSISMQEVSYCVIPSFKLLLSSTAFAYHYHYFFASILVEIASNLLGFLLRYLSGGGSVQSSWCCFWFLIVFF